MFDNAVFDECRAFLSTDGYEEKCRYDFCALDEMRDILLADCGVAAAYVQQCKVSYYSVQIPVLYIVQIHVVIYYIYIW